MDKPTLSNQPSNPGEGHIIPTLQMEKVSLSEVGTGLTWI